ncbi:MAG: exodeoxyribonuclease V subunit alpha [Arenimonas sp.]
MSLSLLFSLLKSQHLRDVDHALAMSLHRLEPETSELVCVAVALASKAHSLGHSCLPLDKFDVLLGEASTQPSPQLPGVNEFLEALKASGWVGDGYSENGVLVLDENTIALKRYWSYEDRLAKALRQRLAVSGKPLSENVEKFRAELFSEDITGAQAIAAKCACEATFFLLTGGPGTGKTSTISRLLQLLQYQAKENAVSLRIALAAPTGKAATRLSESLHGTLASLESTSLVNIEQAEAKTLHRLLGSKPNSVQFQHDAEHPLPLDVLIVDEASMIDLPLMCKLLEALPLEARLILVGDPDQLPSVETGNVLRACCDAIALRPDSSQHRVHLDRVYRQDSDSDIGLAAKTVLSGDSEHFIQSLLQGEYRGLHWQAGDKQALEKIIRDKALLHYQKIQQAVSLEQAISLSKEFRVLCAARESSAGSIAINRYIGDRLKKKNEAAFFPGRLCLVTENTAREQLFNGDIGLCWPDDKGVLRIWVETVAGLKAWHPANFPAHEDAFAITVHKSQGSEFERILLVLPDASHRVLSRELLYTGITRARRQIELFASQSSLIAAISRQNQRWSRLARRLESAAPSHSA